MEGTIEEEGRYEKLLALEEQLYRSRDQYREIWESVLRLSKLVHRDLFQAREVFEAYPLNEKQLLREEDVDILDVLKDMSGEVLRHATEKDYKKWLVGYLLNGGKPNQYFNQSFNSSILSKQFYVAKKDFRVSPLDVDDAVYIIVPKGIKFLGGERGCIELFFMDGYKSTGWVPVFKDVGNSIITSLEVLRNLAQSLEIQVLVDHLGTVTENLKLYIEGIEG